MVLEVEKKDSKFRLKTPMFSTNWIANTEKNRQIITWFLGEMEEDSGRKVFSTRDLAEVLGTKKMANVSNCINAYRYCGENAEKVATRKKQKLDPKEKKAVQEILRKDPLESVKNIAKKARERLKREDITEENIYSILQETGCHEVRAKLRKQLVKGKAHYKEKVVIDTLFSLIESKDEKRAQLIKEELSLKPTEPTSVFSVRKQNKEKEKAKQVFSGSSKKEDLVKLWQSEFGWQLLAMCLYLQGVSTSTIGSWFGVHKSTISRWLDNVAFWGESYLSDLQVNFSGKVAVDEKWIKIAGCWWYLFAAIDCKTGFPLCTAIYSSNSGNYCRLFLEQLKVLGYHPKLIITDGWNSYPEAIKSVFPEAEHLYCRFHAIKSLFRRLKEAHVFDFKVWKKARKLFQSPYKRTVERRVKSLRESLALQNKESALEGLNQKYEQLLKTVGSKKRPSTANAAERFFGSFDRLYRLKGPFPSEKSAQKHLKLFLLGYMFKIGSKGQPSPLEQTGFSVAEVPFYHLVNRPNILMLKERVQQQHLLAG